MMRAILGGLFSRAEAERHFALIQAHLAFPDGVRLMDRPAPYAGGVARVFQRAETAACFGREIGLMYVHAHLRYAETLAVMGKADDLLRALLQATPILLQETVPNALPRQSNVYFSSSDGAFADRYEAQARFEELRAGRVPVRGGWRLYSSGPGIYTALVITRLLGLRRHYEHVVLDPVLPAALNGLEADVRFLGRLIRWRYRVTARGEPAVRINGVTPAGLEPEPNPYRRGGLRLPRAAFLGALGPGENLVEIRTSCAPTA